MTGPGREHTAAGAHPPAADDTLPGAPVPPGIGTRARTGGRWRRVVLGGLAAAGLAALGAGRAAHLAVDTRDHLEAARSDLMRMRVAMAAGDTERMGAALASARAHATEARRLTGGPTWWLLARAPVAGDAATTVRGLAVGSAELTGVLADVRRAGAVFLTTRRHSLGDVRQLLAQLAAAAPVLDAGTARLARTGADLSELPARTGVDSVDRALASVRREVAGLRDRLGDAATAAALLPPMLGHAGPRGYFLAFQTNAEARGTGGLVGAYGILAADRGRVTVRGLAADDRLAGSPVPVVDHGPAFQARYGADATRLMSISNLSPHLPYAARTWTGLWERTTGRRLDGAVAIDPVGLSYLLEVTGPVTLPGGEKVTAGGVVDLTERVAYERYPDQRARKRFLLTIAEAVAGRLPRTFARPFRMVPVLARLAGERRLQVWSRHDAEERRLSPTPLGGVLPETPGPYAQLVVNNSAGGKLDFYLGRTLHYRLRRCAGAERRTTVRARLVNDVPAGPLPGYVAGRLDAPGRAHVPGANKLWVSLYAAVGARLRAARLDGVPVNLIAETERSHPVFSAVLEMAPRRARILELDLVEPYSAAAPAVPVQPLARPQLTRIADDRSGCPR
ncbi:hypothetical protein Sru01_36950 [Sphaerisporangium rufum]|uniref:DUF4012 domain-containing protein n=1 Tax=Sphaerisporangium rufum TaxID=1381558 RepID=A0A919R434_9ACTN|nr:DUF4012 domain-containing protein [Sphaerisporangium rufum]GII78713.1 hypothetical protein Sru01_36950 [Sphaerisporangium rufum]